MDGNEGIDPTQASADNGGGDGTNPAWNQYYGEAPQEVRDQYLTPAFKAWDDNVNNMVQKVHSEYEPWKPVISQTDPDTAKWAIGVANQLNTNPQLVYEALGDFLKQNNMLPEALQNGANSGQGQQQPQQVNNQDEPWKADIANLQHQNKLITDWAQAQQNERIQKAEDTRLENELTAVKQKFNLTDADIPLVLGFMANTEVSTEQAGQMVAEYQARFKPKPLVMGSGGGVPGTNINPAKLDDKGTKNLVVQMLMDNQAQNQ